MQKFLVRRLTALVPVVLGVVTMVFFIIHLTPGDPVEIMLGETASKADMASLRKELGLDKPLPIQYVTFIARIASGDLGRSIYTDQKVFDSIIERYPATAELALASMALALAIAIPLGVIASARKGTAIDHGAMAFSLVGVSMPSFWIGPLLILVFAIDLGWLPASGRGGLASLVLPSITLGTAMRIWFP